MSASTNPESCEDIALRLVNVAHPLAKSYFRTSLTVDRKADSSPVTEAGRAIEQSMQAVLGAICPDHVILGEEFGLSGEDARSLWGLDPIDGTKASSPVVRCLARLLPCLRTDIRFGGIDMPMFGETWVGQRGETTRLNGAACHISGTTRLKEAVFSEASPDQFTPHAHRLFDALSHACAARRFGGIATAMAC
ncbi:inositol monophosphatase family protein [Celeribacter baekdonensis]|uniref:Histidinol phosphate phosphatase n=1 Tax=Celeribacter baekdonensis TaxID=875171 RepID=A0A2R4M257_9RHOB|nr:inositol monophosphatase family protein [Celeribacter baekdonensis]AVW91197.1 histidinol phosphate phosphatase [Celeribacter baekdonensis]